MVRSIRFAAAPEFINSVMVVTFPECILSACNVKACIEIGVFRLTGEVQVAEETPLVESVVRTALLVGKLEMVWLDSPQ